MKKLSILVALLSLNCVVVSAHANVQYNVKQLEQFETTNKCSGCDLSSVSTFQSANHSGAVLDNANLSSIVYMQGPGFNLSNANLQNANLSGAYLPGCNFSEADMTGARLDGASLEYANFYGAKGADLTKAAYICSAILPNGSLAEPCKY
jgi:uncharacterized protein YjbI with pentapeptide repeats